MKVKRLKGVLNFPFDENGITSLLFLEETNQSSTKDKKVIKSLIEIYAVF